MWLLFRFMRTREAFELRGPMLLYNAVQIGMSALMTVGLAPYLLNKVYNIGGLFEYDIEFWVLLHYVAKYLDMFDTFFIIARKKDKQLSLLHLYHHVTIGIIWGMLLHWGVGNGTPYFGAWINSLVHALMYSHYLFTSLGFENPFKTLLTKFQMLQFFLCVVHAVLAVALDPVYPSWVASVQMFYHPTLLYLFYDYLVKEQKLKKQAAAQKKDDDLKAILKSPAGTAASASAPAPAAPAPRKSSSQAASRASAAAVSPKKARSSSAKKDK